MAETTETNRLLSQRVSLRRILIEECGAMAAHALGMGKSVPEETVQLLERLGYQGVVDPVVTPPPGAAALERRPPSSDSATDVPEGAEDDIAALVVAHCTLARVVAPATPRTIVLLRVENAKAGMFRFLGAVAMVRRMTLLSVVLLAACVALACSHSIDMVNTNIFELDGIPALIKQLYWICAAGLGAVFAALYQANRYINTNTFDPRYEPTYWIRFILGVISGLILAGLLPLPENLTNEGLTRPVMALIGGFSVSAVYRILYRMVEALEWMVRGDGATGLPPRAAVEQPSPPAPATTDTISVAVALSAIRTELAEYEGMEQLMRQLDEVIQGLDPGESSTGEEDG